ncbi:MAG: ABC transporter substrate-binding protein [Burkholderiales bacterium]|nr:ABC transporter substrate-binding protein [Burkholderiales bacterium]
MIRFRIWLISAGFLSSFLPMASSTVVHAADAPTTVLRMADQKGGSRALLEAAGELKNLPYRIEWSEFPAAAPLLEALNAGAVDSGPVGDAPLIFALAAGAPVRVIGAVRSDPYGTAIIAPERSALDGAASLKGHRIATGKGSIGHWLLLAALDSVGLSASDVTIAFMLPADARTALATGAIDAWSTWEPYTAFAEVKENAKIVVNGRGLWSGLSYQVGTTDAIRTKRSALQDYLRRLARAQRWANDHVPEYAATLSQITGIPQAATQRAIERRRPTWMPIDDSVVTAQQRTADVYAKARVIPRSLDVKPTFDRSFETDTR